VLAHVQFTRGGVRWRRPRALAEDARILASDVGDTRPSCPPYSGVCVCVCVCAWTGMGEYVKEAHANHTM